jgi:hypothetical protein
MLSDLFFGGSHYYPSCSRISARREAGGVSCCCDCCERVVVMRSRFLMRKTYKTALHITLYISALQKLGCQTAE